MAARVLLQRGAAPVTATLLAGGITLYPKVAHAEAPVENLHAKKPIYDDFETKSTSTITFPTKPTSAPAAAAAEKTTPASPSTTTHSTTSTSVAATTPTAVVYRTRAPTPTDRLAAQIRLARLFVYSQSCAAEDAVNGALARAFALEQSFTGTLASLAPPRESGERLMPGAVYVLVAGMAGSVVARNRNVLVRGAAPLAFGLGAAWLVLPVTSRNVADLLWKYEQRVPALAEAHVKTREGVEKGWSFAVVHAEIAKQKVEEGVRDARETVEGWVRKGK